MIQSRMAKTFFVNKNIFSLFKPKEKQSILFQNHIKTIKMSFTTRKKKRVVQLSQSTIQLSQTNSQENSANFQQNNIDYLQGMQKIKNIGWEDMSFEQLCSLDRKTLDLIELDLKKQKFNISDEQILTLSPPIKSTNYQELDTHYKKIYTLLKNQNRYYEEFKPNETIKNGYLNEMFIMDLKTDVQLQQKIAKFIKNIHNPQKLEAITQPTFVKHLMGLKRQLMLLGVKFPSKAERKMDVERKKREPQVVQTSEKQSGQLPKIKILEILNYDYEFWQDVKHNRAKNGGQQNFIIENRQIQNPNNSILIQELYPTINVKYIVKKTKSKQLVRNFCVKADLLIQIDQSYKRRIKVQWQGPSNKKQDILISKAFQSKAKKTENADIFSEEQITQPKIGYIIIDYENLYQGNPTVMPVFHF